MWHQNILGTHKADFIWLHTETLVMFLGSTNITYIQHAVFFGEVWLIQQAPHRLPGLLTGHAQFLEPSVLHNGLWISSEHTLEFL